MKTMIFDLVFVLLILILEAMTIFVLIGDVK